MDRGAWWAIQFMDSQRVGHNWASEHWKQVLKSLRTSLVAQTVKCLSTMWETQVRALGWEDPLEKETAIHSSTIAWKIPWTEEPGRLQSMGPQRVRHDWATSLSLSTFLKWQNYRNEEPVSGCQGMRRELRWDRSGCGCKGAIPGILVAVEIVCIFWQY